MKQPARGDLGEGFLNDELWALHVHPCALKEGERCSRRRGACAGRTVGKRSAACSRASGAVFNIARSGPPKACLRWMSTRARPVQQQATQPGCLAA